MEKKVFNEAEAASYICMSRSFLSQDIQLIQLYKCIKSSSEKNQN